MVSKVQKDATCVKDLQRDLLLGVLNRIRAVADVTANGEGEVATDSS